MKYIRILSLVAVLGVPAMAQAQLVPPVTRIDRIHTDLAVEYVNGDWRSQIRIDPSPNYSSTVYDPSHGQLIANGTSLTTPPAGSAFDFLGVTPGSQYWKLNQNLQSNQLYLGTSSEQMLPNSAPGGGSWANWLPNHPTLTVAASYLELQVRHVRGPAGGNFSVWQSGDAGPDVFVSTALNGRDWLDNGTTSNGNAIIGFVGSHIHYNWGFTAVGQYEIDIAARTKYFDSSGVPTELLSNPVTPFTFSFDVTVPVPEPIGSLALVVAGVLVWRRRMSNSIADTRVV